jgi:pimeloyl-ACP methyl ester carboxylesterase
MTTAGESVVVRLSRGEPLLAVLVHLPGDEEMAHAARAGIDIVVVDLVDGPADEIALRRLVRFAHWAGLGLVALSDGSLDGSRLRSMGLDGVATSRDGPVLLRNDVICPFTVVRSRDVAHRRSLVGSGVLALDLNAALDELLASFASIGAMSDGLEPLVLLPGMLADARLFDAVVDALPKGVITHSVRIDLDDSIAEMAESVLAVAPERFALAGHSLGGIVALEICRRAPERVTKLALLNTSARPASDLQLSAWAALRDRTDAGEFATVVAEQAVVNVGPGRDEGLIERWADMAAKVGPDGFLRQLRAQVSRPDSRPSLAAIAVPTVVISGAEDGVCPQELQEEMVSCIPQCLHVTVGGGHMTPLDHPTEVAEHLASWLNV